MTKLNFKYLFLIKLNFIFYSFCIKERNLKKLYPFTLNEKLEINKNFTKIELLYNQAIFNDESKLFSQILNLLNKAIKHHLIQYSNKYLFLKNRRREDWLKIIKDNTLGKKNKSYCLLKKKNKYFLIKNKSINLINKSKLNIYT